MTQINLKLNAEKLTEAIMNSDMDMSVKTMVSAVMNAQMEAERDEYVNAERHRYSEDRTSMRNGYYHRALTLPVGTIDLKVPRTRDGQFSTDLFDRYQRMDQALVLTMQEAVINGVSTRKMTKLVESLCGTGVSKSFISNVMARLDPEIKEFSGKDLHHHTYRYMYVDAMYIKVRENNRVISKAVYIATGVNENNYREVLGFKVSAQESEIAWREFFNELRQRGLQQPKLIISDAHTGLKRAIEAEFLGSTWQRCTVHFLRNIIGVMPKDSTQARTLLKRIFRAETAKHAQAHREAFEAYVAGDSRFDTALNRLDEGYDDATQFYQEPEAYHQSLRTSNNLERLNQEVRRRERVVRIFPNINSATRLIGAVLMDINAQYANRRPFLKNAHTQKTEKWPETDSEV
jgi:putative transposase